MKRNTLLEFSLLSPKAYEQVREQAQAPMVVFKKFKNLRRQIELLFRMRIVNLLEMMFHMGLYYKHGKIKVFLF